MKQLRWTFFHVRLWALELKLWMDGFPWNQVRILARRPKDFPDYFKTAKPFEAESRDEQVFSLLNIRLRGGKKPART